MTNPGAYSKTFVAVATAVLTAAQTVNIAGGFTLAAWLVIATAGVGAFGTYTWPNTPTTLTPTAKDQ